MKYSHSASLKAIYWHAGQMYGTHNYAYHLEQVASMVRRMVAGKPIDEAEVDTLVSIAWLHDILEDTAVTREELEQSFSEEIIVAVECLTKRKGELYLDYIDRVKSNDYARLTKIADSNCNLTQSIIEGNVYRINKYTRQLQLLIDDPEE